MLILAVVSYFLNADGLCHTIQAGITRCSVLNNSIFIYIYIYLDRILNMLNI